MGECVRECMCVCVTDISDYSLVATVWGMMAALLVLCMRNTEPRQLAAVVPVSTTELDDRAIPLTVAVGNDAGRLHEALLAE